MLLVGPCLQGALPGNWGDLLVSPSLQLQHFECAQCSLSGLLPTWGKTGSCSEIGEGFQYLDLSGNSLNGPVPDSWKALTNLKYLDLSANQFTGVLFGPGGLCDSYALETLKVYDNQLTSALFGGES